MMAKHPLSVWSMQGTPDAGRTPAPADVESWGLTWKEASYEYLIGVAARAFGTNSETVAAPAFIESQRRLRLAIDEFNAVATKQGGELVTLTRQAGRQADTVIRLTAGSSCSPSCSASSRRCSCGRC